MVSGCVLSRGEVRIYIAGDTIWCDPVALALSAHRPTHIVLNTGGARFLVGDPITMTASDVEHVVRGSGASQVIAVHMDTINHCFVTRRLLQEQLQEKGISVTIPSDGEKMPLK